MRGIACAGLLLLVAPVYAPLCWAVPTQDGIALTKSGKVRHWKSLPVSICVAKGLPSALEKELAPAAAAWNQAIGREVFRTGCRATTLRFDQENLREHSVFLVKKGFGKTGDPLALARTLSSFDDATGELLDADILINAENFDWKKLNLDVRSVLVHELGHVLGLQHLSISTESVMNQYPYQSGIVRRELKSYELSAIKNKYGKEKGQSPSYIDSFFSGDYVRALTELKKVSAPTSDQLYGIGILQLELKDDDAAIRAFEQALAKDPHNVMIRYRLGDALSRREKTDQAAAQFEKVIAENPNFYEALADLGLIRMQQGKIREARALFERTLEVNPVHYPACHFLLQLTGERKYSACLKRFAPAE